MLAVVEHIEYEVAAALLHDIYRVLEPGGILILTTPAAWTDVVLRAMAKVRLVSPVEVSEHKAAYDRTLLSSLLGNVFPGEDVRTGTFELGLNIWASARKTLQDD
jgi:predicted SAM-dependent methyltransferase